MKNVVITPETAQNLAVPVRGCPHPRGLLSLVDGAQLLCLGCGTWFPVAGVEENAEALHETEENQ